MYFFLKDKQFIDKKKDKLCDLLDGIKNIDHIVKVDQYSCGAEMTNVWPFKVLEAW